ncbi:MULTISPECIES: PHA/PHB synthase family protein [Rhodobacterales]|jgi:polyhydroxyalkanoate synthase|uniref:Poly(R)-hydroxyalkanoic acid synthase n=1 Tax=Phaeobacter gallaeciensis TaxID=60890 RepID=A0A1B0ZN59_9RHOB|nr:MULTISPECIES: class I poly(R)-hydroxyalkanoic acid synthase [Phaeobacter]MDF1771048.1 class I poly(R)-hydroxyalkanoic acid synthase [Pseudophaeobacter sp. bin_em_oilr2.035]ANP35599.1 poly(R)-hydroxyalkanoic acid synthase [Phaeobacter gallaeciensis]MDE4061291.1 class I poly(R)-hydroxyalkanoic acid synthase [Phaeobacter gallaeciensis]MDE4098695.1 class I poly(R)-hydroxyalkanoic acid synthase [Phaeobacter gallaeciensis]MDE4107548.1 class I poly(R)-hydroxyalkanoic acid synthase [Phaeobacter gal
MTTSDVQGAGTSPEHIDRLKENLEKVEHLSKRLVEVMASKKPHHPGLDGPNQELFARAATSYWASMLQNPAKLLEHQIEYWGKSVLNFAEAQQALAGQQDGEGDDAPSDRRFTNPMWDKNPYFRFIKQQYMTNAAAIREAVDEAGDLDRVDRQRLSYFADQIIHMMAPTNFLPTNPDALERALETEGQSLIKGLENLVADLEANDGELVVRLADDTAFEIGRNLATTPGEVVYRNRMMELIQYRPTTDTVHETPILLFPPWINKFYILDLKAQNSLIKWVTDQGYTLFVVSWVNPDASYSDVGLEDYVQDGFLTAIEQVKEICKVKQINAVGYCIAGTTLGLTLSLLKQRGDKSVKSATFFTALTDFDDQGEFTPFLQNDFVDAIEEQIGDDGMLPSYIMARTFSFLRANDLVYGPAIRSYMMGETPPAFDLLYWNGDGANLPGKMAIQYLRGLCQGNQFAKDGFELLGHKLQLKDVDIPLMAVTCETDHIARWKDCYRGVQQMGSRSKNFIVSQSGHIAGIVNPPTRNKYGHYTNDDLKLDAAAWMEGATFHEGSWWPRWEAWLKKRSGKQVPAREPGDSTHPPLVQAPGDYVRKMVKS